MIQQQNFQVGKICFFPRKRAYSFQQSVLPHFYKNVLLLSIAKIYHSKPVYAQTNILDMILNCSNGMRQRQLHMKSNFRAIF